MQQAHCEGQSQGDRFPEHWSPFLPYLPGRGQRALSLTSVFAKGHTWPQEWAWQLPESSAPYAATHHSLSHSGLPSIEYSSTGFPDKTAGEGGWLLVFCLYRAKHFDNELQFKLAYLFRSLFLFFFL